MNDDDLEARLDAFSRAKTNLWEAVDALQAENERLQDRVTTLERVVAPDPTSTEYDALTREQKVFQLRTALTRLALNSNGRAAMKYDAVQAVFGNRPSPGHAYDLMEHAAEAEGFNYSDATGEKRLTVRIEGVNDDAVIHAANNDPQGAPA